jgi:hypothetical protein
MSSDIPYAYAAPAVVYGIVVEDPRAAILVRRVLNLSIVMGILGIISAIIRTSMPHPQLANTKVFSNEQNLGTGIFYVCCALLVPCCGYFGAKQRDRGLLTMFWICNCINSCCFAFGVVGLLMANYVAKGATNCVCKDSNMVSNSTTTDKLIFFNAVTGDCVMDDEMTPYTCKDMHDYNNMVTFITIVYLINTFLGCAGCIYGRELTQQRTFVEMRTEYTATPIGTMEVNDVQKNGGVTTDYAELK